MINGNLRYRVLSLSLAVGLFTGLTAGSSVFAQSDGVDDNSFSLTKTSGKTVGFSNPLYTQKFGADPWAMEYDGRLYVYMTNDTYEYDSEGNVKSNSYGTIKHINVISSADMVNWTDHGSIPVGGVLGIATWANNSWAPCAVWRNENGTDKFYLYFTNGGGGGIGVLVGESPIGPWKDPNGKAMVNHSTENCSGNMVPWCFDPAVFIDGDGSAYMYFGGGIDGLDPADPKSGRVVKLKDNLTEIDGVPQEIAPPYFFEALAMHKYNGKYYLSYAANFRDREGATNVPASGSTGYMMADSPMGPFEYAGELFAGPGRYGFGGGNNHQCAFEFKGVPYLAYHGSVVGLSDADNSLITWSSNGGGGYRSTHIDILEYNDDGTIKAVTGTKEGIRQLEDFNPYGRIEAETIAWNGGIRTVMDDPYMKDVSNLYVTDIQSGDWTSVSQAALGDTSPTKITFMAAGKRGGTIELRTGSPDPESSYSTLAAEITVPEGDGITWQEVTGSLTSEISGTQNLFFVFKDDVNGDELFDLDWWMFGDTEDEIEPVNSDVTESPESGETAPTASAAEPQEAVTDDIANTEDNGGMVTAVLITVGVLLIGGGIFFIVIKKKGN